MSEVLSVLPQRNLGKLAEQFAAVAMDAGAAIMGFYGRRCATREKADRSPVTEADEAAEKIIVSAMTSILPDVPIVAEEAISRGARPEVGREFVLVDALDGTLEFIKQNDEFTVNIALIRDGSPACGVVLAPAIRRIWTGGERAMAAGIEGPWRLPPPEAWEALRARPRPGQGLVALASRSHADPRTEAFLATLPIIARKEAGSSIKFCLLAEGLGDVYARFGPTMEWDTAAGNAVLRSAGGVVEDLNGSALRYGKTAVGFRNFGFVAWGAPPAS